MDNTSIHLPATGIGQDSHRFSKSTIKPLILAGITIQNHAGLEGNSDADVVLHALCNGISSISGINILGEQTDTLCKQGITDSKVYLDKALKTLTHYRLTHISISIECKTPSLAHWIPAMRQSIALATKLLPQQIGITATTGEGLTDFGKGKGIQVLAIVSALQTVALNY